MLLIPIALSVILLSLCAGIGSAIVLVISEEKPRWAEVVALLSLPTALFAVAALLFYVNDPAAW